MYAIRSYYDIMGFTDARELKGFLVDQAMAYPKPVYYALMNLLSSHDIERIRTALSTRLEPHSINREQQASFRLSDSQNKKGAARQRLASVLQFALPGVPCRITSYNVCYTKLLRAWAKAQRLKDALSCRSVISRKTARSSM